MRLHSGAIANLTSTFTQPDHRMGIELLGRGFRIEVSGRTLTYVTADDTKTISSDEDFYKAQDQAFIEAVRQGDQTLVKASYQEGVDTLAVTLAANQSFQTGKMILI